MDAGQLANTGGQNNSRAAGLQFVTAADSTAHFVATIGWKLDELSGHAHELLNSERIDTILDQKAADYGDSRPHIQGLFAGAPEAIGTSMFWNGLYVPSLDLAWSSLVSAAIGFICFGGWVVGE
jgi:hypothetical protein